MLECEINIFIINLLLKYLHTTIAESVVRNAKEIEEKGRQARRVKKRKGIEALRVKHPTLFWAIDALTGNEE